MHAVLPDARPARQPAAGRRRNFTREQRIADGAVFGSATVMSLTYALEKVADAGHGVPVGLLLALVLTVHALPLLWRRRALGWPSPRSGAPRLHGRCCWGAVCCRRPPRIVSWAAELSNWPPSTVSRPTAAF
ncbi:hypothetical protein NKH18_38610 [Streptomyces sp. M10(2022)]